MGDSKVPEMSMVPSAHDVATARIFIRAHMALLQEWADGGARSSVGESDSREPYLDSHLEVLAQRLAEILREGKAMTRAAVLAEGEQGTLLRRAVGFVSDSHKLAKEAESILDAYVGR